MVTKAITIAPGRALAQPKAKKSISGAGLALINEALDGETVHALTDSNRFLYERHDSDAREFLGDGEIREGFCERAKPLHARWLTSLPRAVEVRDCLSSIIGLAGLPPRPALTYADAMAMLSHLFGAMGKRRDDEAVAKLSACADIFGPTSNELGRALGLWKPAPRHPFVLAVAIKKLMAEKTFEPAESELREALSKVEQTLRIHYSYVDQWLEKLERADDIVFAFDRPAWNAAYAAVPSDVPLQMQGQLFEEYADEPFAPSPRWQALNDLWEQKVEQEKAAAALPHQSNNKPALAACAKAPAKKTKRLLKAKGDA